MGLYAKLPFAVAPGMGVNAFFTFSLILGQKIAWPIALGIVFWAGIVFLIVSVTPVREAIAEAIPSNLRVAAGAGIGLFLTFIGLKNSGLVVANPATLVSFGGFSAGTLPTLLGVVLIAFLMLKKNPFSMLIGMVVITGLAALLGEVKLPEKALSAPDFSSLIGKFDAWGALKLSYVPAIIALLFTDLFDSISTFVS